MKQFTVLLILCFCLWLPACESQKAYSYGDEHRSYGDNAGFASDGYFGTMKTTPGLYQQKGKTGPTSADINAGKSKDEQKRLIKYDATLNMSVKRPDSVVARAKAIAEKYEGYAQTLSSNKAVIRVKSEHLSAAIAEISVLGTITYRNIYADDVTEQFYDYKIRLENMEKARKRYLELLEKAQNVQETLLVEKELERLNSEIDVMKGKLSRLEHLVAYSTITVNVEEKKKPGVLGYVFVGIYKGVKWLFVRN